MITTTQKLILIQPKLESLNMAENSGNAGMECSTCNPSGRIII